MSSPRHMPPPQSAKQQEQPSAKRGAKLKNSKKKKNPRPPPPQMLALRGGRIVPILLSGAPFVSPWPRGITAKPSVPPQRASATTAAAASTSLPPLQKNDESKAPAVSGGMSASHQSNKQIA